MFDNRNSTPGGIFDGLVNKEVRITLDQGYVTGIFLGSNGMEFKLKNISVFNSDNKYIRLIPEYTYSSEEILRFELNKK